MNSVDETDSKWHFVVFNYGDGCRAFESSYLEFYRSAMRKPKVRLVEKGALVALGYSIEHRQDFANEPDDKTIWHCLKYDGNIIYFSYGSGVCEIAYSVGNYSDETSLNPQEMHHFFLLGFNRLERILNGLDRNAESYLLLNSFPYGLSFHALEQDKIRDAAILITPDTCIPCKSIKDMYIDSNQVLACVVNDHFKYLLPQLSSFRNPLRIVVDIDANYRTRITLEDSKSVRLALYDLGELIEKRKTMRQ